MGILRGIQEITNHKKVAADEDHYQRIAMWTALYHGYYSDFHDVRYRTIAGEKTRRMSTLGMPKVISAELARLVFNEKCAVNISDEGLSENISQVFEANNFDKEFQRHLEYGFAKGGFVIKVFADDKGIKLSFVTADSFFPISTTRNEVHEGVFVNETRRGDKYYTLLEWNEWDGEQYVVTNELFMSEIKGELGIRVPLETLYPNLEQETRINNLSRSVFVYIKPNTANNFDTESPLGISVYANALDTLKALDTAFDSFEREFRLGKKRILVPHTAIKSVIDPQSGEMHRYFDANDEVYQAFNFSDENGQPFQDVSVSLRVQEHIDAIQALLDILAMQTGFSPGTFTFDAQGVKTATEVISENSKTFRTKNSHETTIEEGLKELIITITEIAKLYGFFSAPDDYEVTIDFDDSIAEDREANADYYIKLKNAGLASSKYTMMKVLDITEEQAGEMLREIREEQRTRAPDINEMFGGGEG